MFVDVIEYNGDFPEGFIRNIPVSQIKKFYTTPKGSTHIVRTKWDGSQWSEKYKELMSSFKLFTLWDAPGKKQSAYVKVNCHPVTIEVEYASDTHIYDDSTYIQSYFSDMSLEEFKKICDSSKCIEEDEPIENRWDILDLRKK